MLTIGVKFRNKVTDKYDTRTYNYWSSDTSIKEGDFCVVEVEHSGIEIRGLQVVQVVSTEETLEGFERANKWIIQKVDLSAWKEQREKDRKKALLKAKIHKAVGEARARVEFEQLATISPELKTLVQQLDALDAPVVEQPEVTVDPN